MNSSITQILMNMVEEILGIITEKGISTVGKTAEDLLSGIKPHLLKILSEMIQEQDEALVTAKKERKIDGITVQKKHVSRSIETALGVLTYSRTYFKMQDGSFRYLTDELIGVEAGERVTKELCAKLLQNTAYVSMQKAIEQEHVNLSRQTVDNKLLAMKQVAIDLERAETTPEEIHIFADEDHVHLNSKQNTSVPEATVTEGIDISNPKRHKTIRPVHFQGYGMEPAAFAENILSAIYERYDMEKEPEIVIHGDGGRWIRSLSELIPNSVLVMDGFHLEKYIKKLLRFQGAKAYACCIRRTLREDDFEGFIGYCASIKERLEEKEQQELTSLVNYFQNNWESIVIRSKKTYCGSCTEPTVSHVLSERLSRNPISWSREGLSKMAMVRVYVLNGGKIEAKDIRVSRNKEERKNDLALLEGGLEKYRAYADRQVEKAFGRKHDWSIFEKRLEAVGPRCGEITGTTVLLKACAALSDLA